MNKKGTIAIGEILIMIIGIFAVAWAIGRVSAETPEPDLTDILRDAELREQGFNPDIPEPDLTKIVGDVTPAATNIPTKSSLSASDIPIDDEIDLDSILEIRDPYSSQEINIPSSILSQDPSIINNEFKRLQENMNSLNAEKAVMQRTIEDLQIAADGPLEETNTKIRELEEQLVKKNADIEKTNKEITNLKAGRIDIRAVSEFRAENGKYYGPNGAEYSNYAEYSEAKSLKETGKKPGWGKDGGLFGKGTRTGALVSAASWGLGVLGISSMITGFLSGDAKAYGEALSPALAAGVFTGKLLYDLAGSEGFYENSFLGETIGKHITDNIGAYSVGIGAAVTIAVFVMMYSEEEEETITFTCDPWDAPSGGNDCEKCNNNKDLPCSEYQCKSLGQSCELQNANSDNPLCSWVNRKDVIPPTITLWEDVLTTGLRFTPLKVSSPQDKGTTIVSASTGGCIPAYTPLVIGIKTDEPAKCKVDVLSKKNFSDMSYYFGSSLFLYNHTFVMSVPGQTLKEGEEKIQLKNDGNVQLYVRCQDPNGNVNQDPNGNTNIGNFIFKFCVDASEDTTAPQILGTNIINEMPVAYNTSAIALELYTNEPADCRWDALDKGDYEDMKNTMSCDQNAAEMNAQMVYTCKSTLTGIKSGTGNSNNFYFKCRDKPTASSGRNTNAQNYKLILYGTEKLILDEVKPNGTTIKDNTDPVWVELTAKTSAGYKDGDSSCYYKLPTDREYVKFFTTGSATHSQKLAFETGKYNVSIKCVDAGGNSAEKLATFEVEIDKNAPEIQRIYKDTNYLRTTTNEEAECVYDTSSCSYQFNDGIAMTTVNALEQWSQFTEWKEDQTYYIKCRDKYGNQPDAGSCTIEARMYEKI